MTVSPRRCLPLLLLLAAAVPALASDDAAADLDKCREAVSRGAWKTAKGLYDKVFEEHRDDRRVIAERDRIEDDVQLCVFNLEVDDPDEEALFGPCVEKFSASSGQIELRFDKGTQDEMWTGLAGGFRMLPLRFSDRVEVELPADGPKGKNESPIRSRALLSLNPEDDGSYLMCAAYAFSWGRPDWDERGDPGVRLTDYHRIFRMDDGGHELLKMDFYFDGRKHHDKVSRWVRYSQKGGVLKIETEKTPTLSTRDTTYDGGFLALETAWDEGGEKGPVSVHVSGKLDRDWLKSFIAKHRDTRFREWREKHWKAEEHLPDWLRSAQALTSSWTWPLPGKVPAGKEEALAKYLEVAWQGADAATALAAAGGELKDVDGPAGMLVRATVLRSAGAYTIAEELLTDALEQSPGSATLHLWRAWARFGYRALDEAAADLDAAQAADPSAPGIYELRAAIHLIRGELDEAAKTLSDAHSAGAWDDSLQRLSDRVTATVRGPQWQETHRKQGRHFEVLSDQSTGLCQDVLNELENALRMYTRVFRPLPEERRSARVYVFSSRDAYLEYANELGAGLAHTAGAYLPRLGVLVVWVPIDRDEFGATLRHEGFHQYAHLFVEDLPLWFNEGHAEHWGNANLASGRVEHDAGAFDFAERVERKYGSFVPVEDLIRMSRADFMAKADVTYVQSWVLVRMLRTTEDRTLAAVPDAYFDVIAEGGTPEDAYERVIEPVLPALRNEFLRYANEIRLQAGKK